MSDSLSIPGVEWGEFFPKFTRAWKQGEHVSLIGPTGTGKSTLGLQILPRRDWIVILGTKPEDSTLSRLRKEGYRRLPSWTPRVTDHKILLWPPIKTPKDVAVQRAVFASALEQIYAQGRWCIFVDELRYICQKLKLSNVMELLWLQGRSNKITIVAACQRPAFVPTELYDQATHLFFWRDNDELNLKRIGGIGWLNAKLIRETVARLPFHHVLYINTRKGTMLTTKAEV